MKKILPYIIPKFIARRSRRLLVRSPFIWSLRLLQVIFFSAITIALALFFISFVRLWNENIPGPTDFIAYFIIVSICGYIIWLLFQKAFDYLKYYGSNTQFFSIKICLCFFILILILFAPPVLTSHVLKHRITNWAINKSYSLKDTSRYEEVIEYFGYPGPGTYRQSLMNLKKLQEYISLSKDSTLSNPEEIHETLDRLKSEAPHDSVNIADSTRDSYIKYLLDISNAFGNHLTKEQIKVTLQEAHDRRGSYGKMQDSIYHELYLLDDNFRTLKKIFLMNNDFEAYYGSFYINVLVLSFCTIIFVFIRTVLGSRPMVISMVAFILAFITIFLYPIILSDASDTVYAIKLSAFLLPVILLLFLILIVSKRKQTIATACSYLLPIMLLIAFIAAMVSIEAVTNQHDLLALVTPPDLNINTVPGILDDVLFIVLTFSIYTLSSYAYLKTSYRYYSLPE